MRSRQRRHAPLQWSQLTQPLSVFLRATTVSRPRPFAHGFPRNQRALSAGRTARTRPNRKPHISFGNPSLKPGRYNYTMEACYPVFVLVIIVGIFFYVNLFMVMDKSVDNMLLLSLRDEL